MDHHVARPVHRGGAGRATSSVLAAKKAEIVVFSIVRDSACQECGAELFKGSFLRMEESRPLCMACADLDHLVFLPSGNTALTRHRHTSYDDLLARGVERLDARAAVADAVDDVVDRWQHGSA